MEQPSEKPRKTTVEKAWSLFFKKKYNDAKAKFSEALSADKDNEALYGRACSYFKLNNHDSAVNDLNLLLKNEPKNYKGYHLRGMIKGQLGKSKEALKDIEKSLEINPEYPEGYYDLGGCYLILNEYQKAYDCFERCLSRDKNNAGAWFGKGMSSMLNKEYHKATEYFSIALKLDRKLLLAIMGRCEAYFKCGQKKEAIKDLKKIEKLNPGIIHELNQRSKKYNDEEVYDDEREIDDFRFDDDS